MNLEERDKNLDFLIKTAMSVEYSLWQDYSAITSNHQRFINTYTKRERMEFLALMRNACIKMAAKIRNIFGDRPIPQRLVRTIDSALKPTLSSYYLNLTQLYMQFTHEQRHEVRIHLLTSMYYLLKDMEQVLLEQDCEPERLLAKASEQQ